MAMPTLRGKPEEQIKEAREAFLLHLAPGQRIPTAVICYNDLMALGVCDALKTRGWRIPEDISVIGHDDFYAMYGSPAITTISLNLFKLGWESAEIAVAVSEGKNTRRMIGNEVDSTLIVRESTGPCPDGESLKKKP